MRIESEQLGPQEIPQESVIRFPHGIVGFPGADRFCVLEVKPGSRFKLLQSTQRPDLAFVVTDPLLVDASYPVDMVHRLGTELGLDPDEPIAVAAIVCIPGAPKRPSANLLAPVAIGARTQIGVQVVLHDSPYQVRHAL